MTEMFQGSVYMAVHNDLVPEVPVPGVEYVEEMEVLPVDRHIGESSTGLCFDKALQDEVQAYRDSLPKVPYLYVKGGCTFEKPEQNSSEWDAWHSDCCPCKLFDEYENRGES